MNWLTVNYILLNLFSLEKFVYCLGDRLALTPERRGLTPERRGLTPERRGLTPERLGLTPERLGLTPERLGLVTDLCLGLNADAAETFRRFTSFTSFGTISVNDTKSFRHKGQLFRTALHSWIHALWKR